MTGTNHHNSKIGLSTTQQKTLCALAYLGRYYHSHLSKEKILTWMEIDDYTYNSIFNELSSKGWLVEDISYPNVVPVLLINPKRLSEAVSFMFDNHTEWKGEIESLVRKHSIVPTLLKIKRMSF